MRIVFSATIVQLETKVELRICGRVCNVSDGFKKSGTMVGVVVRDLSLQNEMVYRIIFESHKF